jgi:hypothetical protein
VNIRNILEEREELILSPLAQKSSKTRGRLRGMGDAIEMLKCNERKTV